VLAAPSTASSLSAADIATLVFAGIAALGVLAPLAWWLLARYSVTAYFISKSGDSRTRLKFASVAVGVPMRTSVRIRCRRAIDFSEIQIRAIDEPGWIGRTPGWVGQLGRPWRTASCVKIDSVKDVTLTALGWHPDDPNLPWRLSARPRPGDRGGYVCFFTRNPQRRAGDSIFLDIVLLVSEDWEGRLSLWLPTSTRHRRWAHLRVKVPGIYAGRDARSDTDPQGTSPDS
jgi:hypothetical protein